MVLRSETQDCLVQQNTLRAKGASILSPSFKDFGILIYHSTHFLPFWKPHNSFYILTGKTVYYKSWSQGYLSVSQLCSSPAVTFGQTTSPPRASIYFSIKYKHIVLLRWLNGIVGLRHIAQHLEHKTHSFKCFMLQSIDKAHLVSTVTVGKFYLTRKRSKG